MISSIHVRGEILPMYPILFKYKAFDLVLQKERQPVLEIQDPCTKLQGLWLCTKLQAAIWKSSNHLTKPKLMLRS